MAPRADVPRAPREGGPYRVAADAPPDEEAVALARLAARAQRVRRLVALPVLAAGAVLGAAEYLLLRRGLFEGIDSRAPYLAALVTVLPIVVLAQALAAYLGRRAVAARSRVWIAEITPPGGSPALLEAFVKSF